MQVLRTTFFLLVLGNLLLFSWGQGYFGRSAAGEPNRLSAQITPEKLRIVSRGVAPSSDSAETPLLACRALGGLTIAEASQLTNWLANREDAPIVDQRSQVGAKSWWVYIPPLQNSVQAEKKGDELSKLGAKDYQIVRDRGPNEHAISLGLFKSEERAKEFLASLQKKNIKSARIQVREADGDRVIVEMRGKAESLGTVLENLPEEFSRAKTMACSGAKP